MSNYQYSNPFTVKDSGMGFQTMCAPTAYCKKCGRMLMDPPADIAKANFKSGEGYDRDPEFEMKNRIHLYCWNQMQQQNNVALDAKIEEVEAQIKKEEELSLEDYVKTFKRPEGGQPEGNPGVLPVSSPLED